MLTEKISVERGKYPKYPMEKLSHSRFTYIYIYIYIYIYHSNTHILFLYTIRISIYHISIHLSYICIYVIYYILYIQESLQMTILELARCILTDSSSIQPQFTKLTFLWLWNFDLEYTLGRVQMCLKKINRSSCDAFVHNVIDRGFTIEEYSPFVLCFQICDCL